MRKFLLILICMVALLLAGCFEENQQPKELNICSSFGRKMTETLAEDFSRHENIKVNIKYLPPGSFSERMDFIRTNKIDCWLGGTTEEYYLASRQNMLRPYLSGESYKVPAQMRSREGYWTSLYLEYIAFISNKEKLHRYGMYAPDTWEELLLPQLNNEIAVTDFAYGGAGYGMVTSIWQLRGREKALEYAAELNRQNVTYTDSIIKVADMVYRGEKTIGIVPLKYALNLEEKHKHLFATVVENGNRNLLTGAAIIKTGANQQEAEKFIDYLMDDKSVQALASNGYNYVWHVKDYPYNNMRRELIGNIQVSVDDLSWTAIEKNEIIRSWLSAK